MVPAHARAAQAAKQWLPHCGAWLPRQRTCTRQLAHLAAPIPPVGQKNVSKCGGVMAAVSQIYSQCGNQTTAAFLDRSINWLGSVRKYTLLSQTFNRQSTIPEAKKKEKGAEEVVAAEDLEDDSPQAEEASSIEGAAGVSDADDFDESWEEGIAPLDEVDIPLDGETEDGWEYEEEDEGPIEIGDGGDGGGIKVGSTLWGKKALEYAEEVLSYPEFAGRFRLYAFRAYDGLEVVKLRLDKLEDTYGSPTMEEIQSFARAYNAQLDEAMERKELPIIETEVGSPGAERVVQVPADLGRFQDLPMVVRFMAPKEVEEKKERKGSKAKPSTESPSKNELEIDVPADDPKPVGEGLLRASLVDPSLASVKADQLEPGMSAEPKLIEHEEVLALESFDLESRMTTWKLADTRANRASGKGRGLNRRQRDQRWHLPFSKLKLVRLYLEI